MRQVQTLRVSLGPASAHKGGRSILVHPRCMGQRRTGREKKCGTRGRARTGTAFLHRDFKSLVSTIPPRGLGFRGPMPPRTLITVRRLRKQATWQRQGSDFRIEGSYKPGRWPVRSGSPRKLRPDQMSCPFGARGPPLAIRARSESQGLSARASIKVARGAVRRIRTSLHFPQTA